MTPPLAIAAQSTFVDHPGAHVAASLPIPRYLEQVYWWAYVHPTRCICSSANGSST